MVDSAAHSDSKSDAEIDCINTTKFSFDANKEEKLVSKKLLEGIINDFLERYFDTFSKEIKHRVVQLCNILIKVIFYSTIAGDLLQ